MKPTKSDAKQKTNNTLTLLIYHKQEQEYRTVIGNSELGTNTNTPHLYNSFGFLEFSGVPTLQQPLQLSRLLCTQIRFSTIDLICFVLI